MNNERRGVWYDTSCLCVRLPKKWKGDRGHLSGFQEQEHRSLTLDWTEDIKSDTSNWVIAPCEAFLSYQSPMTLYLPYPPSARMIGVLEVQLHFTMTVFSTSSSLQRRRRYAVLHAYFCCRYWRQYCMRVNTHAHTHLAPWHSAKGRVRASKHGKDIGRDMDEISIGQLLQVYSCSAIMIYTPSPFIAGLT